jgi:hypothetical protein
MENIDTQYQTITLEMQTVFAQVDRAWISTFHKPHQQPIKRNYVNEQFNNGGCR